MRTPRVEPRPFLKWVGGKRQLLPEILRRLPAEIDHYVEPFLGGGAVFFALAAEGRIRKGAHLSDANEELVTTYRAVRDYVEDVIFALDSYRNEPEVYERARRWDWRELPKPSVAARMIYLNKTGFNGLYRVNRAGKFNTPFGRYAKPTICDAPVIRAASRALRDADVDRCDFEGHEVVVRPGSVFYFDPPYLPVSATSDFTSYTGEGFGIEDHRRLAALFDRLARAGVPVLLSNSSAPAVRELYARHRVEEVSARRSVNSVGSKRGAVTELLVSGIP